MTQAVQPLLSEVRRGLERLYGQRLRGLFLFGSQVRGDQDSESDVDLLVVLDDFQQYGAEVDRTAALMSSLSLAFEVTVTAVFVRQPDWDHADTPFLNNVRAEAKAA